ncbi:hypothetical protein [Hoeflea sp.]|uniref:hypothetical protein n=1 Tax=Hoeflea sp. TaxID=1940281 RepID=UPI0019850279|nr:hypothetical protein [Hoeflea sp.]MBC7282620.1 hypothetical protein [Hoeflea sp.]
MIRDGFDIRTAFRSKLTPAEETLLGERMYARCKLDGVLPRASKPKGNGAATWRPDPVKAKLVIAALEKYGPMSMRDIAARIGVEARYAKPTIQAMGAMGDLKGVYLGRQKDAMTWFLPENPAAEAVSPAVATANQKGDPSVSQGAVASRQQPGAVVPASGKGGPHE